MSASRWSLGTFLIITCFFLGATARAEEEMMETTDGVDLSYSSLSVEDTRLDVVEGNPDLVLSAKLRNTGTDTRTFRASVEFRMTNSEKNDASRVRSPESYTLSAGEERAIAFSVFRPAALSGSYVPTLVIGDDKGNVVTMMSFAPVELTATEQVEVQNCTFGPSDGDNGVLVTALDAKESEIIIACEASLKTGKPAAIRMVARAVDGRTAEPMILGEKTLSLSSVALPVRLFVPTKVAGFYQLEVAMVNENNQDISTPVRVPLTVKGSGGKITAIGELMKSDPALLPVRTTFELNDDAEYELALTLKSNGVECASPVMTTVQGQRMAEVQFQVMSNCPAPIVSATLLSDGSTVLDQAEKTMSPITGISTPMMEASFFDGILSKLPWIIVAILGVFAGYFIFQKERLRRMAPVLVLALASVFFGFSVDRVQAASTGFTLFCSDAVQSCPIDSSVFYNFETNKNVYAPGETINVEMRMSSDDHPVPSNNLCPVVQMSVGGGGYSGDMVSGCYTWSQMTSGTQLNLTLTAPMTSGTFDIRVLVGQNGYLSPPSRTMSGLSVAAAPTPTASLNISPSTATFPTTITYTLSSTNAQSCEVVQTLPTTATFINKSANTTGTSLQSQVAVGSYQFQTRCWSGPNGTGTVSSTDTDSLTINAPVSPPSASFTSTPSCTIALNGTGCNTTLGWTSANLTTAVLTNCSDTQITSAGVGARSFSPVYVPYNSGCYRIHDGTRTGPVLATGNVNSSCVSGTSWNTNSLTCVSTSPVPVNGTCGSDAGRTLSSSPSNYCATGTVGNQDAYLSGDTFNSNGFISAGPANSFYLGYYWECNGSGGGSSRGCFAYRQPLCGSADGGSYSNAPTDDSSPMKQTLCQVGTPSSVTTNPTTYTWSCTNGTGPTDTCSATRTTGPTARITARVVVATEDQSFWKKFVSFVTGRNHTAQATGPDANITTSGTAAIDWTSSGASSCAVTKQGATGTIASTLTGSQNLSGATLGVGTHIYNLNCAGAPLDSVRVVVTSAGPGGPGTPGSGSGGFFTATADTSCGSGTVNLAWNNVSGATSYELRDGSTQIYSGASTSYSHTGLVAGSTHSYTVRAINSSGNSSWSSSRSATVASACAGGGFTVNLTASPASIASGSSTLTWTTSGNPTWCWATGGTEGTWNNTWQSVFGGSRSVSPSSTTTYTLECGDASTSVSDSATVTVGSGFTCTGSMSNNATVYSGDSTGLSANTPYSYSATNTAPKCQYTCNTGYTWDGSQCAGPSVTLTASPSTIASGGTSTLTWTPSSGVTSCFATNGTSPWTNSSRSASGGTLAVSPSSTTTYSIECWNGAGVSTGIRNRTITVTGGGPAAAVNICPGSATLGVASTQQFAAYYTAAGVTFNGCGSPNGTNVTSSGSTTWSTSNATVATMNNGGSKGLATGVAAGSATMSAVYSGLTGTASVTISCTPTNSCSSASSDTRAAGICAGDTFTITDGCGGTLTCSGTRVCDYNWKEVAP